MNIGVLVPSSSCLNLLLAGVFFNFIKKTSVVISSRNGGITFFVFPTNNRRKHKSPYRLFVVYQLSFLLLGVLSEVKYTYFVCINSKFKHKKRPHAISVLTDTTQGPVCIKKLGIKSEKIF